MIEQCGVLDVNNRYVRIPGCLKQLLLSRDD
jgi:hypothetical protein